MQILIKFKKIENKVVLRKKVFNEFIIILVAQIISTLIALFGVRILTEYLGPTQYGILGLSLTVTTVVGQLIYGPFSNSFSRFYSIYNENKRIYEFSRILLVILKKILVSSSILFLLFLFIIYQWNKSLLWIAVLSFIFASLNGINGIFDSIQNAARDRLIVAFHQICFIFLKITFAIILIILFSSTATAALSGYNLAGIIIISSQFIFLNKRLNFTVSNYSINSLKEIKSYASPFIYWGIFTFIHQISDKWSLLVFQNTENVGLYSVLYQLGYSPIIILTTALVKVLAPILFEKAGDASNTNRMKVVKKYNTLLFLLSISITLISFVFVFFTHEIIFKVFVAASFNEISYLLPYVVLAAGFFATGQIITIYQLSQISSKHLLFPKIFTSIIGLVLNIFCAYLWGIKGIIFALIIYSLIYLLWMILITYLVKDNEN